MCLVPHLLYLVFWYLQLLPRRYPLITWVWWPGGFAFQGPMRLTIGDGPWQAPSPRAFHRQQTEIDLQPSCERYLLASPGALVSGASFSCGTYIKATKVLSWNIVQGMPSLCSLSTSLQLTSLSKKGVCIPIWSCDFCHYSSQNTFRLLGLGRWAAVLILVGPQVCTCFHSLNGIWL